MNLFRAAVLLLCAVFICAPLSAQKMLGTYAGMYYGNGYNVGGVGTPDLNWDLNWQNDDSGLKLWYLLDQLSQSKSNTYFYRFSYTSSTHWEYFDQFLKEANVRGIDVYAYLPPKTPLQPFGTDHAAWATALADLADTNPNLKGMAFDDFDLTRQEFPEKFGPASLRQIKANLRGLDLLLTCYYKPYENYGSGSFIMNETLLQTYKDSVTGHFPFDGIIYPVIVATDNKWRSTCDYYIDDFPAQLNNVRKTLPESVPLYTMLYATGYGTSGVTGPLPDFNDPCVAVPGAYNTSINYLDQMGEMALELTDGLIMYHLQTHYRQRMGTQENWPQDHLTAEKRTWTQHKFRAQRIEAIPRGVDFEVPYNHYGVISDYAIQIPHGAKNLTITLQSGVGNADLYVSHQSWPEIDRYDYKSDSYGPTETVYVAEPHAGTYKIMLKAKSSFYYHTLRVDYDDPQPRSVTSINYGDTVYVSGRAGDEKIFKVTLPADLAQIRASSGCGDVDLYLGMNMVPTTGLFHWAAVSSGDEELLHGMLDEATECYIMVRGRTDFQSKVLTFN